MPAEATVPAGRLRLRRIIERTLFASGLVGLIGIDQDIIRWSGVANWVVARYRAVADRLQHAISSWFDLRLPDLAVDVLVLAGIVLAAANAYSLRRYGSLAFAFAMRLFFLEQVRQISCDHYFAGIHPRELKVIALLSAYAGVLTAIFVFLALPLPFPGAGWRLLFNAYVLFGFVLLSNLDDKVPMDEPGRFQSPAFRRLALASVLFLPAAVLRYAGFIIYCVIFAVLTAWRWHLLLVAVFAAVVALNEVYLRFAHDWPAGRPDCSIYSIRPLCPAAS